MNNFGTDSIVQIICITGCNSDQNSYLNFLSSEGYASLGFTLKVKTLGRHVNSANSISKTEVTIMYSNNCDCEKNNYISYINCYLQFQDWSQNRGTET